MNLRQISSSLVFITMIAILTGEELHHSDVAHHDSLPLDVVPLHYNIKLTLFLTEYDSNMRETSNIKPEYGSFQFHGEADINIKILRSTQNIKLHQLNLYIHYVHLYIHSNENKLIKNNGTIYIPKITHSFKYIELYFSHILSPGHYTLEMKFESRITDNNARYFVRSTYINKEENTIWLITPHIQGNGARELFPCWDEPHFKAIFTISVNNHQNFSALSNMPINTQHWDNESIWTNFYTTPPMSTNQISIVITNALRMNIKHNISLWCKESLRPQLLHHAVQVINDTTLHFESEFGIWIMKVDYLVIPNLPYNFMWKWGLIFHREADLIYDEKFDPVMRKIEIARSVASKIAYRWLGNVSSPPSWSDFWLYEGLANLFGEKAIVQIFQSPEAMDLFIVQDQYDSLHLDSHFDMNPLQINNFSAISPIFRPPSYFKVIIILRMLQDIITHDVLKDVVHIWLSKYNSSNEFWAVLENLTCHLDYHYFITHDFQNWVKNRHYPIINITQEDPSNVKVAQNFNSSRYGKWSLPIYVKKSDALLEIQKVWLLQQQPYANIAFNTEKNWIMADIRQAGYYRIHYDAKNWRKIAIYLNSKDYKNISVVNRAKIIDDAFHFLLTRQINASVFWEITGFLWQETDYAAWYPMFKVFEYISSAFPLSTNESNFVHVKLPMRRLLYTPLAVIGFEERPMETDFTKFLRQEIVKWACIVELADCLNMAKLKLEQHLTIPESIKILPEWRVWTFCKGFIRCSVSWPFLDKVWPYNKDKNVNYKYMEFIPCFQDKILIMHRMFLLLGNNSEKSRDSATKENKLIYINFFHSFVAKHVNNEVIVKEILLLIERYKPRQISTSASLIIIINHIYNTTLLNIVNHFVKNDMKIDLKEISSKLHRKIETRVSEIESQFGHFDILLNKVEKPVLNVKTDNKGDKGASNVEKPVLNVKTDNKGNKISEELLKARRIYTRLIGGIGRK